MKIYLTLTFLFLSKLILCQTDFDQHKLFDSQKNALLSEVFADIDGDNKLDIIVCNYLTGISWYKNLGNQNFSTIKTINTNIITREIKIADLDGDNDMDIIFSSDAIISWLENTTGLGDFDIPKTLLMGDQYNYTFFYLKDINNDQSLDLILTHNLQNKIYWYANEGEGNLGSPNIIQDSTTYSTIPVDIDSDGDLDLLTLNRKIDQFGEPLSWYENVDGLGNFNQKQVLSADSSIYTIYPADIDGDGDIDLFASSFINHTISWYENLDGLGNFGEGSLIIEGFINSVQLSAKDINNDGFVDLIVKFDYLQTTQCFENLQGNGFSPNPLFELGLTCVDGDLPFGDVDDDGDLDFLGTSNGELFWLENNGGPNYFDISNFHDITFWNSSNGASFISTIDIDDDGDLDLITSQWHVIVWYENINEEIPFDLNQNVISILQGDIKELSDFDNDGDLDLLVLDAKNNQATWKENLGGGLFGQPNIIHNIIEPINDFSNYFSSDVNNDGYKDVISTNLSKTIWMQNLMGTGAFGEPQFLYSDTTIVSLYNASADLDGDGDDDLIFFLYVAGLDSELVWFKNDGSGEFSKHIISYSFDIIGQVKPGDVDGDGDLDIVVSPLFENNDLYWFENQDGLGDFSLRKIIGPGTQNNSAITDFILEDLDGDNDMDLVVASTRVTWYENLDGNGHFGPFQFIDSTIIPYTICLGDINGDGDLDVIADSPDLGASLLDDGLFWYENIGQTIQTKTINNNSVNIFPNPASNELFITSKEKIKFVEIYNSIGQKLNSSFYDSKINISKLIPGMYFCKVIFQSGEIKINNFIKE